MFILPSNPKEFEGFLVPTSNSGFGAGLDVAGDGTARYELINMAAAYVANGGPATDYPNTDSDGDGLPDWLDNLVGPGTNVTVVPPFLDPNSPFWKDIDGDGLADLLDHNINGNAWGTLAPLPDNDGVNDRDWRDISAYIDFPIELLYFDAARENSTEVLLTWATATELDNKGFEVERMLDNETEFSKIGFIDGLGTSFETNEYFFYDNNSYDGISYYRLRQIDFDKSFEYTDSKAVSGENNVSEDVTVFPNPINDNLNIKFDALTINVSNARFTIVDVMGRIVLDEMKSVAAYQTIRFHNLTNLTAGAYVLNISIDGEEIRSFKLVKN